MAKGVYRVQRCGALGREKAKDNTNGGGKDKGE
jgi:hypothetical protein